MRLQTASIVAVGSELLGTRRLDTNSLRLASTLERWGIELQSKSVVGDSVDALADEIRRRIERVDLVITTGGLGPTTDDVTRGAVAQALGRGTYRDESVVEHIRGLFASFDREMPEVNERQAEVIEGARVLRNDWGTAPALRLDVADGTTLFLLPGVPKEMEKLVDAHLEPWLESRLREPAGLEQRVLKIASVPESVVEERIAPAYERFGAENLAVLASPGDIKVFYRAMGIPIARRSRLDLMGEVLRNLLDGLGIYAEDEEATLEQVAGRKLAEAGRTVVTAESCTGGLVAQRLTRVPGSSAYFEGGVVTYSNRLKRELLDVPQAMLEEHGAVSEPVARAMAVGARDRYGVDYAISVTGIAGPGGGSAEKPVGLVHLGIAGPGESPESVVHERVRFPGDRGQIRLMTSQLALELLRRRLAAD
ncbi:MAG: competence/damage-inducible protein A [Thermoanaerobaculia bacterium]|nr:competence/damage-inducible protein A [Thermoanaerobaculia bacterium]